MEAAYDHTKKGNRVALISYGTAVLGPTSGGTDLEDINAPECGIIEQRLREIMNIPVFHDDRIGTAVICAAGLINPLHLSGNHIQDVRIVVNGAGASGIADIELLKGIGAQQDNCILCDTKGVIWQGRTQGKNHWKSGSAARTDARSLQKAVVGGRRVSECVGQRRGNARDVGVNRQ